MTIEKLTESKQLDEIKKSYKKDFPVFERMPFFHLKRLFEQNRIEVLFFKEEAKIYGYMVTARGKNNYILIEFFAILEEYRNKGYGSTCLKLCKEYYQDAKAIILEAEKRGLGKNEEENRIREKRIAFYEKNGYQPTKIYAKIFGVIYEILVNANENLKEEEILESEIEIKKMLIGEKAINTKCEFKL